MADSTTSFCSASSYCVDLPYPCATKVQKQNTYYASLLAEDYAGSGSEMTATSLYMYAYLTTSCYNEEIACILKRIGIAEMTHMSLLGKLICALGCSPKYQTYSKNECPDWTAATLTYGCNLKEILKYSIAGEAAAIEQYNDHIKLINDGYVKAVLERIILDEQLHASTLAYFYSKCQ